MQRNAYFAHPENILLAMIYDEDAPTRKMAWEKILKARHSEFKEKSKSGKKRTEKNKQGNKIRTFKVPTLDFGAKRFYDIIDWDSIELTVTPLIVQLSEAEIEANIASSAPHTSPTVYGMPCHTQAVERLVKVVTESSSAVASSEARMHKGMDT